MLPVSQERAASGIITHKSLQSFISVGCYEVPGTKGFIEYGSLIFSQRPRKNLRTCASVERGRMSWGYQGTVLSETEESMCKTMMGGSRCREMGKQDSCSCSGASQGDMEWDGNGETPGTRQWDAFPELLPTLFLFRIFNLFMNACAAYNNLPLQGSASSRQ